MVAARHMFRSLLLACGLIVLSSPSRASFDEALKSYQAKDFPNALETAWRASEAGDARATYLLGVMHQGGQGVPANPAEAVALYEKAARGGIAVALSKLAQAYARGDGVAKDREKALFLARAADRAGDAEGALFLSVMLSSGELGYLNATGKPDPEKYRRLAMRPLAERALDGEARDALYRAAGKEHPMALASLALTLGGSVGDGNRQQMQAIVARLGRLAIPALQNYERIARHMDSLGDSYASPQLFADSQLSQTMAGMIATCGLRERQEGSQSEAARLVRTEVLRPVQDGVYLPSALPAYRKTYLIAGEWEEAWTYEGCGRSAVVKVRFAADGLGGARVQSAPSVLAPADRAD